VEWYDVVSRTDPSYTAATFGLARCRLATGDRAGALAALERVSASSSAYVDAQVARIRTLLGDERNGGPELVDVHEAAEALAALPIDPERRTALDAELLAAALALVTSGSVEPDHSVFVLERPLTEREVRLGLEQRYRELARRAGVGDERIRLVDLANSVRPRTWT